MTQTIAAPPSSGSRDKRRHPRISVCVPIACTSMDPESRPLDMNMGLVQDVSQAGLLVEANQAARSDRVLLTFADLDRAIVEINGVVVRAQENPSGTWDIGILLEGSAEAKLDFIRKLVRLHHYTKNSATREPN